MMTPEMSVRLCLILSLAAFARGKSSPGLTYRIYENAALAGVPSFSGITDSAQLFLEEHNSASDQAPPTGYYLSGELLGSITFSRPGVYSFDCQFANTSYGFVWLDGHLVCRDENAFKPRKEIDNPLPLQGGKNFAFRARIASNDTSCENRVGLTVFWTMLVSDRLESNGEERLSSPNRLLSSSDLVTLMPFLPPAERKREALQRNLTKGWGAWLRSNILSVVKLPEGIVITPQLCRKSADTCLSSATPESKEIRVGLHAYDRSYVSYSMAHGSANVTIEYSVSGDHIMFLVTPTDCPNGDCSDYEIQINGRYGWYIPGSVTVSTLESSSLLFSTPGFSNVTVSMVGNAPSKLPSKGDVERNLKKFPNPAACTPPRLTFPLQNLGVPLGITSDVPPQTVQEMQSKIYANRDKEQQRIQDKFGSMKATVAEAIQGAIMWTLIYNPAENGPFMPVSRQWTFEGQSGAATDDWSYIIFDWDNLFASLLAGLDNREIAYSNVFQVIKSKTAAGFIPNWSTGGAKSQDRTEPPVGAKVMLELYRKYRDTWAVEVVFDDLLDWNNWFLSNRLLQPAGLVTLGSHYEHYNGSHATAQKSMVMLGEETNTMQAARLESGLDNSPMYDGELYDSTTHLMQLYDVGMSSMFVQEAYSLAELADAIGRDPTLGNMLRVRGDSMRDKIRSHLWDSEQGIFANRFRNGTFSQHISPTSFYPLLVGAATEEQANHLINSWLLNASRFCISPHGDFEGNNPDVCYWGLPSISAADPTYLKGGWVYWRGYIWGPMAQILYWALQSQSLSSATTGSAMASMDMARKALCKQMEALMMSQWNMNRHICENYHPHKNATECSGTKFYHWGALNGLIGMVEDGHW